jgi:hypothetical protein
MQCLSILPIDAGEDAPAAQAEGEGGGEGGDEVGVNGAEEGAGRAAVAARPLCAHVTATIMREQTSETYQTAACRRRDGRP